MNIALEILSITLSTASTFFITAVCIMFLRCFYDSGFQWNKKKVILLSVYYLIYTVLTVLLYTLVMSDDMVAFMTEENIENIMPDEILLPDAVLLIVVSVVSLLPAVAEFVLVLYDYQGKKWRGFLRYFWVSGVIGICTSMVDDTGSRFLFSDYDFYAMEVSYTQQFVTYALYILFFGTIFFYLYYHVYKKGIVLHFRRRDKIFAISYSVICLIVSETVNYFGKDSEISRTILGGAFVITAMLIPVFFYYLQISGHYQERTRYQEVYMQSELAHFQQYRQNQAETARFRHDIKNNLLCISDLLQQGKTSEATEYLENMLDVVGNLSQKYVTGDEILDSIVAVKAQIMEQSGIPFQFDGVLAGGLSWKPVDICSVFANALDNAIEACQKVAPENRCISMRIKSTPQFWFVTVENPVAEAVDVSRLFQKNGGYTSKSDAEHHGIGTYNMKHTVESYGAMLKAEYQDQTFILEIMIDKSSR